MRKNIHIRLIKRLALGWLILSLLIGTIVFFVEMEKIDVFVETLALEESKTFTGSQAGYRSITEENRGHLAEQSMQHIARGHFIIVELYDKTRQKVVETVKPESEHVEEVLNKYSHDLHMGDAVSYERFFIGRRIYLQVFVPLKADNSAISGYFEGVYKVDDNTMKGITENILWSLGLVVIVVSATTILFYPVILALNKDLINLSVDLSRANIGMLKVLGGAISKRDSDTHTHNFRVTLYAVRLAETTGLSSERMRALIKGAFLHDVGKIGVSDTILLKPGKLSNEEFEIMKDHVRHGVDIIDRYKWLSDAMDVVKYHHEKFDGSGYTTALRGNDIPINARIFAIADYFDALTSRRPYKEPFSYEKTISILEENRGTHFDSGLLDAFTGISEQLYHEISGAEDSVLEETLDRVISKYFPGV